MGQRLRVLHDLQDVLRHSALFHVESDLGLGRVLAYVKLVHVVARLAIDHFPLQELTLAVLLEQDVVRGFHDLGRVDAPPFLLIFLSRLAFFIVLSE